VRGRCETCHPVVRAESDQRRSSSTERGYGSHWRRVIRPAFLRANPLCCLCGALAEVPDHWPVTRAELVEQGVEDPDSFDRLRPLCKECHARHGLSYKPWAKRGTPAGLADGAPAR
jgi:5-methylcytosine-specific restriction protein A